MMRREVGGVIVSFGGGDPRVDAAQRLTLSTSPLASRVSPQTLGPSRAPSAPRIIVALAGATTPRAGSTCSVASGWPYAT